MPIDDQIVGDQIAHSFESTAIESRERTPHDLNLRLRHRVQYPARTISFHAEHAQTVHGHVFR
jgi:hypothetical protein